jgi:hypothetical protein
MKEQYIIAKEKVVYVFVIEYHEKEYTNQALSV